MDNINSLVRYICYCLRLMTSRGTLKKMVELQVENVEEWTWEYSNVFPFSALLFKLLAKEDFVCFSELKGNNGKVKDIEGRESEGERERERERKREREKERGGKEKVSLLNLPQSQKNFNPLLKVF